MNQMPIMQFDSHISGKNAMVRLWPDRIEWTRGGRVSAGKAVLGAATLGASLLATGVNSKMDEEIILIRSISSVTTEKGGIGKTEVMVHTPAGKIGFRCTKNEAADFKRHLLNLMSSPQQHVVIQHQAAPPPMPQPAMQQPPMRPAGPPPQQRPSQPTPMDQLKQLAQMKDAGLVSEQEFEAKKAEILRRM